jgi:hypothetical protein
MRTLVKIQIPVETGNRGIRDGTLPKVIGTLLETWKPEAAYFCTEGGLRTALIFVDLRESSQMPQLAEPLFSGLGATVSFAPVMNAGDLQTGLAALAKS